MLLFRKRTRTWQWSWHVNLWTDSSAVTSWLNLQPSAPPAQAVPEGHGQALGQQPPCASLGGGPAPLQPEVSPVCHPWPQGPRCSSSFLPSPASVLMAAAWLLGFISVSGEERLLSLIIHVLRIHRTLPGVAGADWESAKFLLHAPFRSTFALSLPSPAHTDCGSLATNSHLLCACQQLSRIQEKLILLCLFWAMWCHLVHPCSECFAVSLNKILVLKSSIMLSQMPKAEARGCCHSHLGYRCLVLHFIKDKTFPVTVLPNQQDKCINTLKNTYTSFLLTQFEFQLYGWSRSC